MELFAALKKFLCIFVNFCIVVFLNSLTFPNRQNHAHILSCNLPNSFLSEAPPQTSLRGSQHSPRSPSWILFFFAGREGRKVGGRARG